MKQLLLAGLILLPFQWGEGSQRQELDLVRINQALREWLVLIEADRPYLVIDRAAGEVRLQHGPAVLRNCPVLVDSLGSQVEVRSELKNRIRRYRPSDPWARPSAGPFDWEQNLVEEATPDCALYFANQLLIYASPIWGQPRPPALQLEVADLQVLYNVAGGGVELLVLPPHWNEEVYEAP